MKIAICTGAVYPAPKFPEADFVSVTNALKAKYCELHGYRFLLSSANPHPDRIPHMMKFRMVLECLLQGADWAVWMDADAAPVTMSKRLEDLFLAPGMTGGRIIVQDDVLGLNAGVFACPNTPKVREWLEWMDGEEAWGMARGMRFADQDVMAWTFTQERWAGIRQRPVPSFGFNSYDNVYPEYSARGIPNEFADGHWCLHAPGCGPFYRASRFRYYLHLAEGAKCPSCGGPMMPVDGVDGMRTCSACGQSEPSSAPDGCGMDDIRRERAGLCGEDELEWLKEAFLKPVKASQDNFLDYGSPDGLLAAALSAEGIRAASFDCFAGASPSYMPDTGNRFSIIYMHDVIRYMPRADMDAGLLQAAVDRLLLPGGWLFVRENLAEDGSLPAPPTLRTATIQSIRGVFKSLVFCMDEPETGLVVFRRM